MGNLETLPRLEAVLVLDLVSWSWSYLYTILVPSLMVTAFKVSRCTQSHTCLPSGGSRGQSGHGGAPIRSVNETWPPAVKDFYHTKMAHILVSVYSVFFQPHSTSEPIAINNIHIIDLVYTCIITFSDSYLAPSLSMTYCTPSDHLLHFH